MNIRIRLEPISAAAVLAKLGGHRFKVTTTTREYPNASLGAWTEELRFLDDDRATLETIREVTGCPDVDVMFEGDFHPPGERPFSRLTVVLNDEGQVVNAFFG